MAAAALLGSATHAPMDMYMDADGAQPLSMRRHKRRRPPLGQRRASDDGNKNNGFDKLDLTKERGRNDSGCFEDLSPSDVATLASPDVTVAHWKDVVGEWEERARAIVAQEVTRMKVMTEQKKRELGQAACPSERAAVAHSWRMEMAAMMDTTHDLMQCVANDLNEASVNSAASSLTPHELGQILEEELTQRHAPEQSHAPETELAKEKVYIVRTKRNRRRKRPSGAAGSSGKGSPASTEANILIDGEHWHETKADSFTIHVAELRKPKPRRKKAPKVGPKTEAASRGWDWTQKATSDKVVWRDDSAKELQQEDYFCDWIEMLKRSHIHINSDINQIFWNISFEPRKRRISHVLDNLPFDDHPDVFCDRCELLETTKKNLRREKRSRPQKCYWNIFYEWKRNLLEPSERKKKKKRYYAARKNNRREAAVSNVAADHGHVTAKARPPKSALHDVMRLFDRKYHHSPKYPKAGVTEQPDLHRVKKKPSNMSRPGMPERRLRKVSAHDVEDFFRDFRHMFEERRPSLGRRRSRDERDPEDDEAGQQRSAKRVRPSNSNTALVAMKEDCSSKPQPPISWEEMKRASERSVDLITKNIESKIREAFRAVGPKSLLSGDTATHREFLSLRDEVRAVRCHRKLDADRSDYADIFADWMRVLDPDSLLEQEDFFGDWRYNLQDQPAARPDGKRAVAHRAPKSITRADLHFTEEKALTEHRFTNAKYVMNCKNPFKAEKFHRNLMSKCMAKQPPMRSM